MGCSLSPVLLCNTGKKDGLSWFFKKKKKEKKRWAQLD